MVLRDFILRFLSHSGTRPRIRVHFLSPPPSVGEGGRSVSSSSALLSGAACVTNSSAEFLQENLGVFSRLLSVRELLTLNPQFRPVSSTHCDTSGVGFTASAHSSSLSHAFHRTARGSTPPDSEAACRAAGSDWTFSSRQGADHQHDLRPPDGVSQQDRHPRLLVQPDHVPQNGKKKNKIRRKILIH